MLSGIGQYEPGTCLRYDSSKYIAHASWLLNKTAPNDMTAREWATKNFATPLGVPTLYANQMADPAHEGDTPNEDPDEVC